MHGSVTFSVDFSTTVSSKYVFAHVVFFSKILTAVKVSLAAAAAAAINTMGGWLRD